MPCRPSGSAATRDGRVQTLHGVNVEMTRENGRPSFVPVEGTEFEMGVDLVLLAMGFVGPVREGLLSELDVRLTERGNVWRDEQLDDECARGLYRRGHATRTVAHRVGHRRGTKRGPRHRRLSDGVSSNLPAPL